MSTMHWLKTWRELRSHPGRFALVVFALVIGLWGVGSVIVSYTVLSHDLSANFLNTQPPHAIVTVENFQPQDLQWLRQQPRVEAAEIRDYALHRIEIHPDVWVPLSLYGVDNFEQTTLAHLYSEQGEFPPTPGSILIERNGRLISSIRTASMPRIRVGGKLMQVPVSGIVFDPAQPPATQDHFISAYTDRQTYRQINPDSTDQRVILRFTEVTDRQQAQQLLDSMLGELQRQGKQVRSATVPMFNSHPHQWQLDSLLLMQGSIGLLGFVLGAMLVSQLMASLLSRQIRQIAILKAIGATSAQVLKIYLTLVLTLGLLSGVLGVPLAVASGYGMSIVTATQLNFDILTQHLPWWLYGLLVVLSLVLPILFSLPAIAKGIRVSVRLGLGDYGIQATNQNTGALWAPEKLPGLVRLALRNTLRQKRRLLITLIAMATGIAMFSTGFNVRQSLYDMLQSTANSMRYDVQIVLSAPMDSEELLNLFDGLSGVAHRETWSGGNGVLQSSLNGDDIGMGITALPHDTALMAPRMSQGRWLSGTGEPELALNPQAWKVYGNPPVGSELVLTYGGRKVTFILAGIVDEFDAGKIYIDQNQYNTMLNPSGAVNSLLLVARDRSFDSVVRLQQSVEHRLSGLELSVVKVESQAQRVKVIYDHLDIILSSFVFFALLVLIVSVLGMASAMGINVMERTREIGVFRAIGATPAVIYRLFLSEGMIICIGAIVLGLLLSLPLSLAGGEFWGDLILGGARLPFSISAAGIGLSILITLIFTWLAARLPARKAIQLTTREALAYE